MPQLIIIIIYFAVILVIGAVSRKKARHADDFFVAGRKGSSLFIVGSLLATIIGGSATVGMAGLGFQRGLTGAWWLLAGSIGLIVLGLFFARKVRKFALYTLPGLIEKQYDRRMAFASSVLIVIAWIAIIAAQIIAAGKIMSILGMGSPTLWMAIFSFVFITYTVLGGQYSVIRTDFFQSVIIFGGIFAGLGLLLSRLGGWEGLQSALPADMFSFPTSTQYGGTDLASLLLVVGLTYVVGPDMYSRIFCARDDATARASVFWTAGLIIPIAFAVTLIGMGAAVLFPDIASEQALPMVISEVFSPLVGGIVLAALLCAMMSSADTTLLSASTILTVDIIGGLRATPERNNILPRSRWLIILLGIISLVVALLLKGIISALLFAYTVYTCGVILPVIAGFFKGRLKVTATGALAALIGGGALGIASKLVSIQYLDLGALALSAVLLFLVSFIDNRIKSRRF
ncbi:MAG: sodium:solute symporter family protein [Dehalococcoidales bacterium]|nr:sodium:solute symporter family protein [Dehalococcoidales bacterium]